MPQLPETVILHIVLLQKSKYISSPSTCQAPLLQKWSVTCPSLSTFWDAPMVVLVPPLVRQG